MPQRPASSCNATCALVSRFSGVGVSIIDLRDLQRCRALFLCFLPRCSINTLVGRKVPRSVCRHTPDFSSEANGRKAVCDRSIKSTAWMSAMGRQRRRPEVVRFRWLRRLLARPQVQRPGTGLCCPSWYVQAEAEPRANCRSSCRSESPLFAASNACHMRSLLDR